MGMFSYIAKNKEGQEIRSSIEAGTRLEALEALRKKGLTVVDLFGIEHQKAGAAPKKSAVKPETKTRRKSFQSAKVRLGDLAIFCRQLAISVTAGVPLRDALDTIGQELEHPRLQAAVLDMVGKLNDGQSFAQAVSAHPKIFNVMFQGLIRVAEESGKLPSTLQQLAEYLERTDKLQRRIKAMAAYPMFIAGFFVVVCLVMTLFILPQFSDIFGGFGADLPKFTKIVFGANQFFVDHIIEIFAGVILLTVALVLYLRTPSGAYQKDRLKLAVPYMGDLVMKYVLARFCRSLAIMVNSGVPISTALEICAAATGNKVLEKTVMAVRERILTGHGIADSLEQSGIFPGLVVRMVGVGEDSGQLPEVLERIADLYEDQVEVSIMTTMALFEPVVIVVFGAIVLVIVMAIYLPIITVSSTVK